MDYINKGGDILKYRYIIWDWNGTLLNDIGASLARFGLVRIMRFGGCNFDNRPIDMHISAACALGAKLDGDELHADCLVGGDVFFDKISVGATVNAILLASTAKGKSLRYAEAFSHFLFPSPPPSQMEQQGQ